MLRVFRGDLTLSDIQNMSPREIDDRMQARIKNMERDKGIAEIEKDISREMP